MTNSIAKFADLVQLKDYRPPTKKEYVRYLLRFADHLQRDPAGATEDDLRRYYLFLRQQKHFGPSAMKVAKCALRCFYREGLHVEGWTVFEELRVPRPRPCRWSSTASRSPPCWRRCACRA